MRQLYLTTLTEHEMPLLHKTFLKAFADYLVPIQLNEEQFKAKRKREGVVPEFCVAAFDGDEMVGFIITGLGEWLGKPTAYNGGTGVLPAYRNQQLTRRLYAFLVHKLQESGVEQCILEVIQENTPAIRSYESVGMTVTRSLDCFKSSKEELLLSVEAPEDITIVTALKPAWNIYQEWWDMVPTWQNSVDAVKRSKEDAMILEARDKDKNTCGYVAFYPKSGSVAQLGVHRSYRGAGIGTALLREVVKLVEVPHLLIINIDNTASDFIHFVKRRHFKRFLGQYEMLMPASANNSKI